MQTFACAANVHAHKGVITRGGTSQGGAHHTGVRSRTGLRTRAETRCATTRRAVASEECARVRLLPAFLAPTYRSGVRRESLTLSSMCLSPPGPAPARRARAPAGPPHSDTRHPTPGGDPCVACVCVCARVCVSLSARGYIGMLSKADFELWDLRRC